MSRWMYNVMSSLVVLVLAVGCVTSESRSRHLRTDPGNYAQPDFGSYSDPRGARAYGPTRATPSREYAPSNFYLPEPEVPAVPSYFPPETRYSQPKASAPSYTFQAARYENNHRASIPSYVPQVAHFENNPQDSVSSYVPQVANFESSARSSDSSYVPQVSHLENNLRPSEPTYVPQAEHFENNPRYPDSSYVPQASRFQNTQPEPVYSPVVAYDVSKRGVVDYASQEAYAKVDGHVPPTRPLGSASYGSAVTKFTSPAQSRYVAPIAIVKQTRDDQYDGTFSFGFEGANGIASSTNGYVKAISPKEQGQVMQGTYTYTAPDGTPITTRWFADETGFHAEGAHLPVPARPHAYNKY